MNYVNLILLVFAFVCFVLGTFWQPPSPPYPRFNLIAAGLASWVLSVILEGHLK